MRVSEPIGAFLFVFSIFAILWAAEQPNSKLDGSSPASLGAMYMTADETTRLNDFIIQSYHWKVSDFLMSQREPASFLRSSVARDAIFDGEWRMNHFKKHPRFVLSNDDRMPDLHEFDLYLKGPSQRIRHDRQTFVSWGRLHEFFLARLCHNREKQDSCQVNYMSVCQDVWCAVLFFAWSSIIAESGRRYLLLVLHCIQCITVVPLRKSNAHDSFLIVCSRWIFNKVSKYMAIYCIQIAQLIAWSFLRTHSIDPTASYYETWATFVA